LAPSKEQNRADQSDAAFRLVGQFSRCRSLLGSSIRKPAPTRIASCCSKTRGTPPNRKNTKALEDLPASSLTYTDYDGTLMDKSEFLESVANPSLRAEQLASESVVVRSYGDSAVVTGIHRERGVANGEPHSRRIRFTDTWVSQDRPWQCLASQSSLIAVR
jgi:Domain of unknown function (DUF4440)